jgi:hypothetical protein
VRRLLVIVLGVCLVGGVVAVVRQGGHGQGVEWGSDQPTVIGAGLSLPPKIGALATSFSVAAGVPVTGQLTMFTYKAPNSNRPTHGGRIALEVSVLLDVNAVVPMMGQPTTQLVVPNVEQDTRRDYPITVPALEGGHHCIVVVALEDPATVLRKGTNLSHHSSFAIDLTAGPGPDHCHASRQGTGALVKDRPLACDSAILSPLRNKVMSGGRVAPGAPVWAQVPAACPTTSAMSAVYFTRERPVLAAGTLMPVALPVDGNQRIVELRDLPKGSLWLVLVSSGTRTHAVASPWIYVR